MIVSKDELIEYLAADKKALGRNRRKPAINDYIWKYQIYLRKCEYYSNHNKSLNLLLKVKGLWCKFRRSALGVKCGFTIPINTIGKGLCLAHYGTIIVSEYASIGENCRIHAGVNIGADFRISDQAPCIGNNVYIGPGAKLFGAIKIADGVAIGANAVVNKSFLEENISIAGVPAKKISDKGTEGILFNNERNK